MAEPVFVHEKLQAMRTQNHEKLQVLITMFFFTKLIDKQFWFIIHSDPHWYKVDGCRTRKTLIGMKEFGINRNSRSTQEHLTQLNMMVFPLLLMFVNIWSVCCLMAIPKTMFKINSISSSKPGYVTKLEESTQKLESKQDELNTELKNVSSRVDDLSGRLDTTKTSCTCKQEIEHAAPENGEHEKAMARLEDQIAELKESMLSLANANAAKSEDSSDKVRRLEKMVHDISIKCEDTENTIGDLTESTARLTAFVNRVLYKVAAFISTVNQAASDDKVSLRIDGSSETYSIENINDQKREAGQVNEVFFHSVSLGAINSVYMELHGTDGWNIEKVTIDEVYSGQVYTFNYHAWVDDTDGPQSATLSLTSTYNHVNK
ncbi:uncharacterized protein [Haliotis asinina]|uniref:uncharacterized protein n=1 Tax=Haliotis asinina TaxID=109174 RepID=UPI003531CBC4